MTEKRVFEVVLTGGPCSGKTTAKPWLAKYFGERGFKVLFVPEVATMLIDGGLDVFIWKGVSKNFIL